MTGPTIEQLFAEIAALVPDGSWRRAVVRLEYVPHSLPLQRYQAIVTYGLDTVACGPLAPEPWIALMLLSKALRADVHTDGRDGHGGDR